MDYTIYPFEGLGAIRFGMTPQQVREVVGEPVGTYRVSKNSKFPTDDYFNLGFHVHYDDELGLCSSVGIFSPYAEEDPLGLNYIPSSCESVTLNFRDRLFFKQSFRQLKSWFQSIGTGIQHKDVGVTFIRFGISINSDYYTFPDGHPEYPPNGVCISNFDEMEKEVMFFAELKYQFEEEIKL